jgi:hypothetical protein
MIQLVYKYIIMKFPAIKRLVLLACLVLPGLAWGEDRNSSALTALYQEALQGQVSSVFGAPIFVSSNRQGNRLSAEAYGIVEHSFTEVASGLSSPANWCQFVPLTFNVKACTYSSQGNQPELTFYAGRKFYEAPDDAYQLHYRYQLTSQRHDYVQIVLSAAEGPLGTSDYRIELDAMPAGDGTFVRILSSYRSSFVSRLATDAYLATLGRDKVGFSVVGSTKTGEPIYVGGVKGVIERNAMRYYLALMAFLDTSNLSPCERFEARIRSWFDLSEAHAMQLHELEQEEYLVSKRRERHNQVKLQQQLNSDGLVTCRLEDSNPIP